MNTEFAIKLSIGLKIASVFLLFIIYRNIRKLRLEWKK